ncbi:MAG: hypothetical protein M1828_004065 [Chrysothrix sp. TS-e1954]|nr:MAG: hypothetical protein M1828_004065 [Chrysothrix sp. TS-e1954]
MAHASLRRNDNRIIIHFDYDCFYAAVFEAEDPALKSLPLAVQQKQIIVTCNYAARRRGLYKLQLITEAKKACPDAIIVLGEDLTRFRNASKSLYNFLRSHTWSDRAEKLGFDEVWMDVTDIVEYNLALLNQNSLRDSFFQVSREDPTQGFSYDALTVAGQSWSAGLGTRLQAQELALNDLDALEKDLHLRLTLGSHFALFLRQRLYDNLGYTSTVGIATSKLVSKLVGNVNKPNNQTTMLPPYIATECYPSNINAFLDTHDIGAVPWIGFKLAQKIREYVLQRPAAFQTGLVYGGSREKVMVGDVRNVPDITSSSLEKLLAGPGAPHGIGTKVFGLLHGIDDTEVSQARNAPRQISIEDSYVRLDNLAQILEQLHSLTLRLLQRMRIDLLEASDADEPALTSLNEASTKQWLAKPEILRLTTRPRLPLNPDGTRSRTFKRISRSMQLPNFVFNLAESEQDLTSRLVAETLLPLFKKLHPEKSGWNLSLVNVAVTGMVDTASNAKNAEGRNIASMFKKQDDFFADFKVTDEVSNKPRENVTEQTEGVNESDGLEKSLASVPDIESDVSQWENDSDGDQNLRDVRCSECGQLMPHFAFVAHERYHALEPWRFKAEERSPDDVDVKDSV